MGRQFLVGFATTLLLVALGTRINFRGPDQAGPGEETVSIHGIRIFHREIDRDMMKNLSAIPALSTLVVTTVLLSTFGGFIAVLAGRFQKPAQPFTPVESP